MRALVVSYVFPPTGGAGVGRPLNWSSTWAATGCVPRCSTAANPSVPVQDQSLLRDVPADVEVERVRDARARLRGQACGLGRRGSTGGAASPSLGRRALGWAVGVGRQALMPDPQVLWQPAAQLALGRRLLRGADDVVVISARPFAVHARAARAAAPGIGVVLDYRDEWSTLRAGLRDEARRSPRARAPRSRRALLRAAHMVTTATEAFRENLLDRFPFLQPGQVLAIPNGYDPEDFPATLPGPPADARELTVTYAGTIFKLTSARGLLGAVRRLHQAEPALARRLRVSFLGRIVDTELDAYAGTEALGVERAGYLHDERITRALAASHLALCLLDEAPFVERIYPAKDLRADAPGGEVRPAGPHPVAARRARGPGRRPPRRAVAAAARRGSDRRLSGGGAARVRRRCSPGAGPARRHRPLRPARDGRRVCRVMALACDRARARA